MRRNWRLALLADSRKAEAEFYIADAIARASLEPSQWPAIPPAAPGERGITEHQAAGVAAATAGKIGLLLGSPGSGKTFAAAAIIKQLVRLFGIGSVAIAAPTGKAAVRCTESMAAYGINLKATTIHSLLGVDKADPESGNWGFVHNERNPLEFQFLIIDESSMLDVPLMRSLLAARGSAHVLFVGDPNQLPPVGHGAPLRDMIAANVPSGLLTEIRRNAGTIVRACAAIRENRPIPIDSEIVLDRPCPAGCCDGAVDGGSVCERCGGSGSDPDFSPQNLTLTTAGRTQCVDAIEKILAELRDSGVDPIWNAQVIVAVNRRSPLARHTLNSRLQELLNPSGKRVVGSPFRVGDKVILLKNSLLPPADDPSSSVKIAVANGEFGRVYEVEPRKTCVEFSNPKRRVVIGRIAKIQKPNESGEGGDGDESGSGCDLDLGYAATCHKMQGSDCDHVIVALDEYPGATGPHGICSREWIFTAISRARVTCRLVGMRQTLKTQCSITSLSRRKTFLNESIQSLRASYRLSQVMKEKKECTAATKAEIAEAVALAAKSGNVTPSQVVAIVQGTGDGQPSSAALTGPAP